MPFQKLLFRPGVDRQKSPLLNEGGWSDASLVRFRDGQPQKWGGWQKIITTIFQGICRSLISWQQLNLFTNVGVGTNKKYYILTGGSLSDITPLDPTTPTGTLGANPFTTVSASSTVTVTHASHGRNIGDNVIFSGAATFNNVTMNGEFAVIGVTSPNAYTITALTTANASGAGGGAAVVYTYLLPVGPADAIFGAGWGAGPWGGTTIASSGTLAANPIATVNLSSTVTVTHTAHGQTLGSNVMFTGATAINNVTLNGTYVITAVPTANTYTVTALTTANATSSGGGAAVVYVYYQPGWGQANTSVTVKSANPRIWSHDNWGEDLLASPRGGRIYQWDATTGTSVRMFDISGIVGQDPNCPKQTNRIFIGIPERHLIALGTDKGGAIPFDPMLVHFSDVEAFSGTNVWTATATNSAGTFRLSSGNFIVSGLHTQAGHLVWTDTTCYLMSFIGTPLVYSFRPQGANAGLISPNAAIENNGTVYWMAQTGFFAWRGALSKLESTMHVDIFGSGSTALLRPQADKVFCGLDQSDNEIVWYYPSIGGGSECDRYVVYNYVENLWYAGALPRTAYIDRSIYPNPIAADPTGLLYYHEIGVDSDGGAMSVFIESGYVDLSSGEEFIYLDRLIPDFINFTGTVTITFKSLQYPGGAVTTKGPYTVAPGTKFIRSPIRGRQVAIRIASSSIGDMWRLGAVRVMTQPDGRR